MLSIFGWVWTDGTEVLGSKRTVRSTGRRFCRAASTVKKEVIWTLRMIAYRSRNKGSARTLAGGGRPRYVVGLQEGGGGGGGGGVMGLATSSRRDHGFVRGSDADNDQPARHCRGTMAVGVWAASFTCTRMDEAGLGALGVPPLLPERAVSVETWN